MDSNDLSTESERKEKKSILIAELSKASMIWRDNKIHIHTYGSFIHSLLNFKLFGIIQAFFRSFRSFSFFHQSPGINTEGTRKREHFL